MESEVEMTTLSPLDEDVIEQVRGERRRQIAKWGDQRDHPAVLWMTILGEEVGEACKAALEGDWTNYAEELVQIAAVAVAAARSHREQRRSDD